MFCKLQLSEQPRFQEVAEERSRLRTPTKFLTIDLILLANTSGTVAPDCMMGWGIGRPGFEDRQISRSSVHARHESSSVLSGVWAGRSIDCGHGRVQRTSLGRCFSRYNKEEI
jgi:hypothetical protein